MLYRRFLLDVLNDNVAGTADDTKTLTLDDTSGALTDDGLVGGDGDAQNTGIVTIYRQLEALVRLGGIPTMIPRRRAHRPRSWCTSRPG